MKSCGKANMKNRSKDLNTKIKKSPNFDHIANIFEPTVTIYIILSNCKNWLNAVFFQHFPDLTEGRVVLFQGVRVNSALVQMTLHVIWNNYIRQFSVTRCVEARIGCIENEFC